MKFMIILLILNVFIYFNDNSLLEEVCYKNAFIAYKASLDIAEDDLHVNNLVFEETFIYLVNNNISTKYLYQEIKYEFFYDKEEIMINIYYRKILFNRYYSLLIRKDLQ